MSSLWTPGGEHPVERGGGRQGAGPTGPAPPRGSVQEGINLEDLTPEERTRVEEAAREMAQVREQIASVSAAEVIANHLMGFYELTAIHLSQQPPNLAEAAVAIEAMRAVLERLEGRLGDNEPTLVQALSQLQLAFVQLKDDNRGPDDAGGPVGQAATSQDDDNPWTA